MSQHKPIYYELCKNCKDEGVAPPLITPMHIAGAFEEVSEPDVQNFIYSIAAEFQYKNGKVNPDGSLGEIKISPKAMVDALAYAYLRKGHN
jgi:hypothetical protein